MLFLHRVMTADNCPIVPSQLHKKPKPQWVIAKGNGCSHGDTKISMESWMGGQKTVKRAEAPGITTDLRMFL